MFSALFVMGQEKHVLVKKLKNINRHAAGVLQMFVTALEYLQIFKPCRVEFLSTVTCI